MATLDADQLLDFRGDVGDDGTVFTDAELQRFYTRANGNYNKAVVLALQQILMNAAKLHNYSLAQSSESRAQVFDHLKILLAMWQENARSTQQIRFVGSRVVPTRVKDEPAHHEDTYDEL